MVAQVSRSHRWLKHRSPGWRTVGAPRRSPAKSSPRGSQCRSLQLSTIPGSHISFPCVLLSNVGKKLFCLNPLFSCTRFMYKPGYHCQFPLLFNCLALNKQMFVLNPRQNFLLTLFYQDNRKFSNMFFC